MPLLSVVISLRFSGLLLFWLLFWWDWFWLGTVVASIVFPNVQTRPHPAQQVWERWMYFFICSLLFSRRGIRSNNSCRVFYPLRMYLCASNFIIKDFLASVSSVHCDETVYESTPRTTPPKSVPVESPCCGSLCESLNNEKKNPVSSFPASSFVCPLLRVDVDRDPL